MIAARNAWKPIALALGTTVAAQAPAPSRGSPPQQAPLPGSVHLDKDEEGRPRYTIEGLLWKDENSRQRARRSEALYLKLIPGGRSVLVDPDASRLTFVTESPVTELDRLVNTMALFGGMVPCWAELVTRDKAATTRIEGLYKRVLAEQPAFTSGSPSGMFLLDASPDPAGAFAIRFASHAIRKDKPGFRDAETWSLRCVEGRYRLEPGRDKTIIPWDDETRNRSRPRMEQPLRYGPSRPGTVRLNELTGYCTCHLRFALRVFDAKDRYIWEDLDTLHGVCSLMTHDVNGDGLDEIVCYREDHGQGSLFVYERDASRPARD